MDSNTQVAEPQNTPAPAHSAEDDAAFDSALGDIATAYSEPDAKDTEPEAVGDENAEQVDGEPESDAESAVPAAATLDDGTIIDLGDGKQATIGELKAKLGLFGDKQDQWFQNYQRKQSELDRKQKEWEGQSGPVRQKAQLFEQLDQQFLSDPVQYALNSVALGVRQGLIDPQVYQALSQTVEQIQQAGSYDPYRLQANAAQMQSRRATEEHQQAQAFYQAQSQVYDLERTLGRFLNESERGELANLIQYVATTEGRVIPLQEAWQRYSSLKPPPKPMAQASPAKVVQKLKSQKPTTERASGRSTGKQGYNPAELDRDLDNIMKHI